MPLNCFKDVTMHIVLDMYRIWSLILVSCCDAHASKVSTLPSEPEGGGIIKFGISTCRNLVQTTSFVSQDVCVGSER
jgi:hypothetical protein